LKLKEFSRVNRNKLKLASKAFDTTLHKSVGYYFGGLYVFI